MHRKRGVYSTLHEDTRTANCFQFLDSAGDLLIGLRVGLIMTWWTIKGAKLAVDSADIGVVDVPVYEVCYVAFRMHGQATLMSSSHQGMEWSVIVKRDSLLRCHSIFFRTGSGPVGLAL